MVHIVCYWSYWYFRYRVALIYIFIKIERFNYTNGDVRRGRPSPCCHGDGRYNVSVIGADVVIPLLQIFLFYLELMFPLIPSEAVVL